MTLNPARHKLCRAAGMLIPTLLAMLCAAACSQRADEPAPQPIPGEMTTVFTITVSDSRDSAPASRAAGFLGDGYDRGEGYENYIDVDGGNFRFYFFGADNRYIAPLEVDAVLPESSVPGSKTYRVEAVVPGGLLDGDRVKIVALANWPSYADAATLTPGQTTIADISATQYAFSAASMQLSATNLIPLYGVGPLQTLSFDALNHADAGRIHLLRAYAKVELRRSPDCPYAIESVALSRYNSRGYCAPADVNNESDYVHGSYDADYVATPRIVDGAENAGLLPLTPSADGDSWTGYVPEYLNKGRLEEHKATLRVRFAGAEADEIVHFKAYVDGAPTTSFDILRNYWYVFTVNKLTAPVVQVVPYNEVDLRPEFGLMSGLDLVPVRDENSEIIYWFDANSGQYYGLDKKTPIKNPYLIDQDPVNGWSIVRDENYQFICYHDLVNDCYYASDRRTRIEDPYSNIDTATGWMMFIDAVTGEIYYYYDRSRSRWYLPDKKTTVDNPVFSTKKT